ncbi:MAG: AarF/ABC1/UbiB kinase family protein [Actinomycetia bacterium]|nr:AarF/ABC1/UbiB kinase family protein [Actinomycetes bacterium]
MSTSNAISISHPSGGPGIPPTRPVVRVATVLRLFFGILWELWVVNQRMRLFGVEAVAGELEPLFRRQAARFRRTAERMGGLLVKVGQFLSSRVDVLPPPFVQELAALQDHVASAPWELVEPILQQEIGSLEAHFAAFDPVPLASASLGQVYRATDREGRPVAVKVQRPHIDRIVAADLAALRVVVAVTQRLTRFGRTFDLHGLLAEFQRTVYEELDYLREAENAERIAREAAAFRWLHVPRVHHDSTTRRVLTMDRHDGIKVNDLAALEAAGISRTLVAERLIHLYLHMVMDAGFFHADPHPGNILVRPDGDLVLLDFGMVGQITPADRRQIRNLFVGVSERRPAVIVEALYGLGVVRPQAEPRQLRTRVAYLLQRYYAETLADVRQIDLENLLADVETLLREEPIQFPAHFAFLGRAISMLVGLTTELDPHLNLIQLFTPYARRFVTEETGGPVGFALHRAREWGTAALGIPPLFARVLRQVEDGELEADVRWRPGEASLQDLSRALRTVATAVWVIGSVALGVWLSLLHWRLAADLAFAWAAVQLLWSARHRRG